MILEGVCAVVVRLSWLMLDEGYAGVPVVVSVCGFFGPLFDFIFVLESAWASAVRRSGIMDQIGVSLVDRFLGGVGNFTVVLEGTWT